MKIKADFIDTQCWGGTCTSIIPRDDVTTLPMWDIPLGFLDYWVMQWDPCRGSGGAVSRGKWLQQGWGWVWPRAWLLWGCCCCSASLVLQVTISDQSLPASSSQHVLCTHLWSVFIVCFFQLTIECVHAFPQLLWDWAGRYISDSPFKCRQMPFNQF